MWFLLGGWIAGAVVCTGWLMLMSMRPRRGEAPEDDGAAWDAGVKHVCWHCGRRLNGPEDGLRIPDRECWECYCARYAPGDECGSVPNYVVRMDRRA